jgi:hypothetical protein
MQDQPMLYFMAGKDWFHEKDMFSNSSLPVSPVQQTTNMKMINQAYSMVTMDLDNLDILHVMDPTFSWYCQDPTCQ